MLLAAFEKPKKEPSQTRQGSQTLRFPPLTPERVGHRRLYSGKDTLSARFVSDAQKYYGVTFKSTGSRHPSTADVKNAGHGNLLPTTSGQDDILISSGTHLQTAWSGNTFSMSRPRQGGFTTASGDLKQSRCWTANSWLSRVANARLEGKFSQQSRDAYGGYAHYLSDGSLRINGSVSDNLIHIPLDVQGDIELTLECWGDVVRIHGNSVRVELIGTAKYVEEFHPSQ